MGETIAVRLLLAFFTSLRIGKGDKGVRWCARYVGGMHGVLGRWEGGIDARTNSDARTALRRYCRACGECEHSEVV